jgi:uncharacterized membrane protein
MNSLFEYLYYRVYKVFVKWDGVDGNRAIIAVTMVQTLIIADLLFMFFSLLWGRTALFPYSKTLGLFVVGLWFILMIFNGRKYDGRYKELDAKWENESENKKTLNGFLVILSMLLPWVWMFLLSKLK